MERMRRRTFEDKEKILNEHENFKCKLKSQKEELERHEKMLEKREADYDDKIIKLRRQRKLVMILCFLYFCGFLVFAF